MISLRTFISRVADAQLITVFMRRHAIEVHAAVTGERPTSVASAIDDLLVDAPKGTHGAIMSDIERIEKLSGETGELAIQSTTMHQDLERLPSPYARALFVFLHHEDGFRRAEEIVYADVKRGGKQWTNFGSQKNLDLVRQGPQLEAFKEALRAVFDTPNVHVEIFDRTRPEFDDDEVSEITSDLIQITIYCEERPNIEFAFIEGSFSTLSRRPVREAAMTYEPATGLIECIAAHRDNRKEMARLLATTLLGCEPDLEPVALRSFNLDVLRERIAFELEPGDGVEGVRISMFRLTPNDTSSERVILESMADSVRDIWEVADHRLGSGALLSDYHISQVRITVRYRAPDSNAARSLPIVITHPHRSNIKEGLEIERLVANKYLPKWGLVV